MLAVAAGSEQIRRAMQALEAAFLIGVEGVTEIWLVRHADCYQDMEEAADPPLSALGRAQAQRLAERVKRSGHAAVYASPFRRALETARAITDDFNIEPRLVEMPLDISEDGTLEFHETAESVSARMRAVVEDMVREHEGKRVVAISHGAAIIACLADVLNVEPGRLRLLPYYTSISTLRVLGDRRMVGTFGDIAHLE